MAKIFRQIRYSHMSDHQTAKYLKYALGEIVLVVLGILIALQINNYNTHREQRKSEQQYLLSLQAEFNNNLNKLDVEMQKNLERRDAANKLLTLFDKNISDTVSNETISKSFFTIFSTEPNYEPSTGVLMDIISSGNLNLIQNQQLREHLASFESTMRVYKMEATEANSVKADLQKLYYEEASVRNILITLGQKFDYQSISENINIKAVFKSIEFENYLLDYIMSCAAANSEQYLGAVKKKIEHILQEINKDLTDQSKQGKS